jgi:hypothetical protein
VTLDEYQALVASETGEHELQLEVTAWLEWAIGDSIPWTAVDHAAKLSPRQAAARKRRGVLKGQADYRFVLDGGRSAEIELKRPVGGRQSKEQRAWEARVVAAGGLYLVCRSVAEVKGALDAWGVKYRGKA